MGEPDSFPHTDQPYTGPGTHILGMKAYSIILDTEVDGLRIGRELDANFGCMSVRHGISKTLLGHAIKAGCARPVQLRILDVTVKLHIDRFGGPELLTKLLQGDAQTEIFDGGRM